MRRTRLIEPLARVYSESTGSDESPNVRHASESVCPAPGQGTADSMVPAPGFELGTYRLQVVFGACRHHDSTNKYNKLPYPVCRHFTAISHQLLQQNCGMPLFFL